MIGMSRLGGIAQSAFEQPALIVLTLLGAWLVSRLVRRAVKYAVRRLRSRRVQDRLGRLRRRTPAALLDTGALETPRATERVEALAAVLSSAAGFAVWVIGFVLVLEELDVRLGPLLAGAGLIGVALGFGAQSLIRDLLTGLFILVEDQFGVGDVIDAGVATGKVEAVTLRATTIRAVDGTLWHIPNGQIARVGNMSQHWSRAVLDVRVGYDTDLELARAVIKRTADELWRAEKAIIAEPEVWGVQSLGPSGVEIRLVATTRPLEQWRIGRLLRERIKSAFDAEGIDIPSLPQAVIVGDDAATAPTAGAL